MFAPSEDYIINNSMGAIFLQTIFHIFKDTEILNSFFEGVLGRTLERF